MHCSVRCPSLTIHTSRQKLNAWVYLNDGGVPAVQVCSKAADVQAHPSPYCYDGLLAPADEHA